MVDVDPRIGADGRTYAEVITTRDKLHEAEQNIGSSFDKHLLTLASGALAVSIGFVEKIATDPRWTILLFGAWSAFAACILTNLLAILISQASINRHAILNKLSYDLGAGNYDGSNRHEHWVSHLNWTALVFFVLGVVLIVVFSVVNQKGALMAKQSLTDIAVQKSAGSLVHISPAPQSKPASSGTSPAPAAPAPAQSISTSTAITAAPTTVAKP
jgi:hypothetical protein